MTAPGSSTLSASAIGELVGDLQQPEVTQQPPGDIRGGARVTMLNVELMKAHASAHMLNMFTFQHLLYQIACSTVYSEAAPT